MSGDITALKEKKASTKTVSSIVINQKQTQLAKNNTKNRKIEEGIVSPKLVVSY
jgi:hypothetical protein